MMGSGGGSTSLNLERESFLDYKNKKMIAGAHVATPMPGNSSLKIIWRQQHFLNLEQETFYSSLQVEILSICLSVITSYSFPFLSDSKLRRVTQPLPRYQMSPIHVSHARQSTGPPSQSTGPPMNRIILFPSGV